jgi:hypothetical protein
MVAHPTADPRRAMQTDYRMDRSGGSVQRCGRAVLSPLGLPGRSSGRRFAGADARDSRCFRVRWANRWLAALAGSDDTGLGVNPLQHGTRNGDHTERRSCLPAQPLRGMMTAAVMGDVAHPRNHRLQARSKEATRREHRT